MQAAGLQRVPAPRRTAPRTGRTSRRPRRASDEGTGYLSLLQGDDGVLWWKGDNEPPIGAHGRIGRRDLTTPRLVEQYRFEIVQGSQVASFLDGLDSSFNKARGLRAWTSRGFGATGVAPVKNGRVLLIVHGTFSRGDELFEALQSNPQGTRLLAQASAYYDQILSFEHPTLSVGPILNALDLARAFANTQAQVDVICHSRGGLVVRWWLEALNTNASLRPNVVFVGAPLQGTSLASPIRLRSALNLMTNVVVVMQSAGQLASLAVPLFGVIAGLMKLLSSVTGVMGRAPVFDAALAMIPGLAAQSRRGLAGNQIIAGNFELDRLSSGLGAVPKDYFVVKANFEPTDPGWAFWRYFTKAKNRLSDLGADEVFPDANDLVVDTASMDALADGLRVSEPSYVLDFGTTNVVHHLNYFAQPETAMFITKCLKLE